MLNVDPLLDRNRISGYIWLLTAVLAAGTLYFFTPDGTAISHIVDYVLRFLTFVAVVSAVYFLFLTKLPKS
jgi:hypothetical protein